MTLEHARCRPAGGVPVDVEEGCRLTVGALAQRAQQVGMFRGDVAEDPVEHDADAASATLCNELVEITVGAQSRVDVELVEGVIAVRA